MSRVTPDDVVRHFRENGLKMLLHHPGNVRELMTLRDPDRSARMDFTRLTVAKDTFVAADYRHLACDLVVKVPYRTRLGGRRRTLTLYILIEHQSEPDLVMMLRVLDYLVQVYKAQVRSATREGQRLRADFRLDPVLPIVLYTGERGWEAMTTLIELVEGGNADFAEVVPQLRPLFLNLSATPPAELEAAGGFLGWVLELLRARHGPRDEYSATTDRVVSQLEAMAETERERWMLFLSYIDAMVYHDRPDAEHKRLREIVLNAIRSDPRRREVEAMMKTHADVLREEGRKEGRQAEKCESRQEILLSQLRERFGRVPRPVVQVIRTTNDISRLNEWLVKFATAHTLEDMGITAQTDE
ncbi:MAG TPA: Rpn family recombination-promoting nuclease/putative transposase [Gemmataceae bacterium]|nr:Rpn family recombination-promoting nuclease/putative transposase [Gemmataceae bacterium]